MIHLYCGDGKGKTTAAVGLTVRAAGSGLRVCFIQFMKGRETGEIKILSSIEGVTVKRGGFSTKFTYQMSPEEKAEEADKYVKLLAFAGQALESGDFDLIVMDESATAIQTGMLDEDSFAQLVKAFGREGAPELVITGSVPESWMIEAADYVTDMEKIKHPFDTGTDARLGIEY